MAYSLASLAMADIISAHDVTLRQWYILDFIRRQSFGARRLAAYVPKLDHLANEVGISRGNCHQVLKQLKLCLVIEERPQHNYGFMFPVGNWKLSPRLDVVEVIRQLALFEAPEHLRDALRETFVEQCGQGKPGREPGLSTARGLAPGQNGATAGETRAYPGVPDSGTPFLSQSRSRIGNEPQTPITTGLSAAVPESGQGSVPESGTTCSKLGLQQCKIDSSQKQYCNVASGVPESGTGRFTDGQQRTWDRLVEVGAVTNRREDPARPFWLGMVRKRVSVVEELLGELDYKYRTGGTVQHPGRFMNNKWHEWGRPNA